MKKDKSFNVVVFASVGGGNFQALVEHSILYGYNVSLLVVDRECGAIQKAEQCGVPCVRVLSKKSALFEEIDAIIPSDVDLIVLAGFMPIVPVWFCEKWNGKIINIHPSLLPAYGGKGMYGVHVQEAVMAAHEEFAGCTVHYVDENIDSGKIIAQAKLRVDYSLTPWELGGEVFEIGTHLLPFAVSLLMKKK